MKPTLNYTIYTPPSRRSGRMSTETRHARALERLSNRATLENKRKEAALALANKAKELAPTIEAATALIPKSPRTGPRSESHIWSDLKLCLGTGKFCNIGRWYRNCTKSTHGKRCKAAHFITPELPDPGFQELLRLWAIHDSLGRKYCRERPLNATPVREAASSSVAGQLPTPPDDTLPGVSPSLKRSRDDNQSPISTLPAKRRRQMLVTPSTASASTSSARPIHGNSAARRLETSDEEFPSPYTAFVKYYKPKAKNTPPEIIDPQVIDLSDDSGIEELSRAKYEEVIGQIKEKKRIRKGKGRAE